MVGRQVNWNGVQALVLCAGPTTDVEIFSVDSRFFLEVAGKPLVYYVLQILEQSGLNEIFVAVPEGKEKEVADIPEKYKLGVKLKIIGISAKSSSSTASILRHLKENNFIKEENLLILPGDLVGEMDILGIIQQHRLKYATVTAVYAEIPPDVKVPGQRSNAPPETNLVGTDVDSRRIVVFNDERIKSKVLRDHPHVELKKLGSCHTYCLRTSVLKLLEEQTKFDDFEDDFFPYVVKKQFQLSETTDDGTYLDPRGDKDYQKIMKLSASRPRDFSMGALSCYAFLLKDDCYRVNSLQNYVRANRQTMQRLSEAAGNDVTPETTEKKSITGSLVGENCDLGERTRVTNSILTGRVKLEDCSSLTDCLVFSGAVIGKNCHLKDCLVGARYEVPQGTKANGETFENED